MAFSSEQDALRWAASMWLHGDAGHWMSEHDYIEALGAVADALGVDHGDVEALQ